jgi:hypothetical protein
MIVDEDRILCDHKIYTNAGDLLQTLHIKLSSASKAFLLSTSMQEDIELKSKGTNQRPLGIASMLTISEKIIIIGYSEYARFSILKWNPEKKMYIEIKRSVLKRIGSTRQYCIVNMKKSKFVKLQIFCVINRDLIRV